MSSSVLLGQVPIVQSIRESGDDGQPIILRDEPIAGEAFMEIARNTVRQVAIRNEKMAPTQVVKVQ
jgi:ATP-binding protein involved in chromosome partitioning